MTKITKTYFYDFFLSYEYQSFIFRLRLINSNFKSLRNSKRRNK